MELRLDRLLRKLRENQASILAAIDADPYLVKRTSGGLVLANATQGLYTPQEEHQLYAKGIVYKRDPYRLVSLPLIKIYNLGERNVTLAELAALGHEEEVRVRYLRKMDGSLIQVFHSEGRLWFTTRGMLEGMRPTQGASQREDEDGVSDFDFVAEARRLAEQRYPELLAKEDWWHGRTLIFELIHPRARKVTDYGDRADLILLACFDQQRFVYLDHDQLAQLGAKLGLNVVSSLQPRGEGLAEQVEDLLASWTGTDEEGTVLCLERQGEVVYRVKVKSPDYLQLMRVMALCTYDRTVEFVEARPWITRWEQLEQALQEQGREHVPEEVLSFYRGHWERYQRYLADLERVRLWAESQRWGIESEIREQVGRDQAEYRKCFAEKAKQKAYSGLIFAALDGRLNQARLRQSLRSEQEVQEALQALGLR